MKSKRIEKVASIRVVAKKKRKDELSIAINKQRRQIRILTKQLKFFDVRLKEIEKEHNGYCLDGDVDKVTEWFQSLPIETLQESLNYDLNAHSKYSLNDLNKKSVLRKEFDSFIEQFSSLQSKLNIAKIDLLLLEIKNSYEI